MVWQERLTHSNSFNDPLRCLLASNTSTLFNMHVRDFMMGTMYLNDEDDESINCFEDYLRFVKFMTEKEFNKHIEIIQRFCHYEQPPTGD